MTTACPVTGATAVVTDEHTATRRRTAKACEACRATRVRCETSDQPGVCKRCLEHKRECISRSVARPHRPRNRGSPHEKLASAPALPSGRSSTFSIDFDLPPPPEVDNKFSALRDTHSAVIGRLFPGEDGSFVSSPASTRSAMSPKSSSTLSHSLHDVGVKPLFNLASAESLLEQYRSMIKYFPLMPLPRDTSVKQLAASKPFVLLAILSSTSGSRTLQGHNLYDEEFRKVLALKFVSGGERSIELLQGLLIYCAWFPFHLRPRNKQAFQYIRMAADMMSDLELDQESDFGSWSDMSGLAGDVLDGIRTYVASFYVVSTYVVTWKKRKGIDVAFTPWTSRCCDMLEQHGTAEGDRVLATLARLSGLMFQASQLINRLKDGHDEDRLVMLASIQTELAQIEAKLPASVSSAVSVRLHLSYIKAYLNGGSIISPLEWTTLPPSSTNLCESVLSLAQLYTDLISIPDSEFTLFTAMEWSRPIIGTIMGVRLSFDLAKCPEYDAQFARRHLGLEAFLDHMSRDLTPTSKAVDVLSASRLVMGVVREKYQQRAGQLKPSPGLCCPMLDGTLDPYWETVFHTNMSPPTADELDLWTTVTMEWADDEGQLDADMALFS